MNVCIHVYIYIYIFFCKYAYLYVYIAIQKVILIYIYIYMYIYMCVYIYMYDVLAPRSGVRGLPEVCLGARSVLGRLNGTKWTNMERKGYQKGPKSGQNGANGTKSAPKGNQTNKIKRCSEKVGPRMPPADFRHGFG